MATEILESWYTTEWNLEKIMNLPFRNSLHPHFPLIVSSMSSYKSESLSEIYTAYLNKEKKVSPKLLLDSWCGGFNRRISEYLGTTTETMLLTANCSSGIYSLYVADLISQEKKVPVLVVCADNVSDSFDLWRFSKLGALDQKTGNPFDKLSKGFRMGTGISIFLVKNSKVSFPLTVKAVVNKYDFWTNNSLTNPGSSDEIIRNLPNIDYQVFDFWNAHAPGTPLGDKIEYEYFSKVIKKDIPIVSYKSYIGHCMTASGGMEIAMSIEGKGSNKLLANKIPNEKIVNDDRIIVTDTTFSYTRMYKTTLGFGGKIAVADISLF